MSIEKTRRNLATVDVTDDVIMAVAKDIEDAIDADTLDGNDPSIYADLSYLQTAKTDFLNTNSKKTYAKPQLNIITIADQHVCDLSYSSADVNFALPDDVSHEKYKILWEVYSDINLSTRVSEDIVNTNSFSRLYINTKTPGTYYIRGRIQFGAYLTPYSDVKSLTVTSSSPYIMAPAATLSVLKGSRYQQVYVTVDDANITVAQVFYTIVTNEEPLTDYFSSYNFSYTNQYTIDSKTFVINLENVANNIKGPATLYYYAAAANGVRSVVRLIKISNDKFVNRTLSTNRFSRKIMSSTPIKDGFYMLVSYALQGDSGYYGYMSLLDANTGIVIDNNQFLPAGSTSVISNYAVLYHNNTLYAAIYDNASNTNKLFSDTRTNISKMTKTETNGNLVLGSGNTIPTNSNEKRVLGMLNNNELLYFGKTKACVYYLDSQTWSAVTTTSNTILCNKLMPYKKDSLVTIAQQGTNVAVLKISRTPTGTISESILGTIPIENIERFGLVDLGPGRFLIFGGWTTDDNTYRTNGYLATFNDSGVSWEFIPDLTIPILDTDGFVNEEGEVVVVGGGRYEGSSTLESDYYYYNQSFTLGI